jgi:hypothetical protein
VSPVELDAVRWRTIVRVGIVSAITVPSLKTGADAGAKPGSVRIWSGPVASDLRAIMVISRGL